MVGHTGCTFSIDFALYQNIKYDTSIHIIHNIHTLES